jgi:hypothetical protein
MTINARHRKHFKSGACVEYAPLVYNTPSKRWKRALEAAKAAFEEDAGMIDSRAEAKIERPEYFQPKTRFERFVGKIGRFLTGRKLAAV